MEMTTEASATVTSSTEPTKDIVLPSGKLLAPRHKLPL
jgi:hypothetical protein